MCVCQRRYVCACERGGQRRYVCACDRCVCAVCVNVGMCVRACDRCVCVRVRVSEEEVVGRRVGGWVGGSARQSVGGSSPKSKNPTQ